jgi:hypothetical protein
MSAAYPRKGDPVDQAVIWEKIHAEQRKLDRLKEKEAALDEPVYGPMPSIHFHPCNEFNSRYWPCGPVRFKLLMQQQASLRRLKRLHDQRRGRR